MQATVNKRGKEKSFDVEYKSLLDLKKKLGVSLDTLVQYDGWSGPNTIKGEKEEMFALQYSVGDFEVFQYSPQISEKVLSRFEERIEKVKDKLFRESYAIRIPSKGKSINLVKKNS